MVLSLSCVLSHYLCPDSYGCPDRSLDSCLWRHGFSLVNSGPQVACLLESVMVTVAWGVKLPPFSGMCRTTAQGNTSIFLSLVVTAMA